MIKYKKFEMLEGPIYSIKKIEVFMLIYQNGTKEYIESKPITANATSPVLDSVALELGIYYYNDFTNNTLKLKEPI